jgi:hypothetical protein
MAIIKVRNPAIDLDAAEIPNLDASKITTGSFDASRIGSGTFADARIAASNVSQHATSFDDNKLVNDISTLALRQASDQNKSAYNTNSSSVDVFQDSTGITNLTNTARNANEYISSVSESEAYETGDRTGTYTVTSSASGTTGAFTNWIDGSNNTGTSTAWYWDSSGGNQNGNWIMFDLGSGNSKVYTGAKMYQTTTNSSGIWKWRGTNDLSTYTDLSSNFTWDGGSGGTSNNYYREVLWSNNTAFRYIEIKGQIGATTTDNPWQQELEFKVKTTTASATGSFENNAITAPSSVSSMGAIITYQDQAGTNALNTDIVLQLSADGGSNYSTATLTALPDFSTGIKMAKVNDLSVTAGTSLKYKLSFANQASGTKEARIRGVALQY